MLLWLSNGELSCEFILELGNELGNELSSRLGVSAMSNPLDDWLEDSEIERQVMLMFRVRPTSRAACESRVYLIFLLFYVFVGRFRKLELNQQTNNYKLLVFKILRV